MDKKSQTDEEVVDADKTFYIDKDLLGIYKAFKVEMIEGWVSDRMVIRPVR